MPLAYVTMLHKCCVAFCIPPGILTDVLKIMNDKV